MTVGRIRFVEAADAEELHKALVAEGYDVTPVATGERYVLEVQPFDDDVVAMVDVYGGWLPDEG